MIIRAVYAAAMLLAFSGQSFAQAEEYWVPDAKTVGRIEQAINNMPLPTLSHWKATSLDTYGRYYTGVMEDGRRVVFGVFLSMDQSRYPPGIHIVTIQNQPHRTGGGCAQLNLWYDVAEGRVTEFHCYGLG